MKRIITTSLVFLLLSMVFYSLLVVLLNAVEISGRKAIAWAIPYVPRKGGQEMQMFRDFENRGPMDVLVLGSSHAYRGYDPREFEKYGVHLFNMGTSSQHPMASYVLIDDFVTPRSTSLVILDVFDRTFELEGMDCTTRLVRSLPRNGQAWQLVEAQPDLRSFNTFSSRIASMNQPPEYEAPGYQGDGYCSLDDTLAQVVSTIHEPFRRNERMFHFFGKSLDLLRQRNIPFVLVSHPQPNVPGMEQYHASFLREFAPLVKDHNAVYLDMTFEDWLQTPSHFADENHLNQAGVTIFNEHLVRWLMDNGYLRTDGK